MRGWGKTLVVLLAMASSVPAYALGHLSPAMVKRTKERIWANYRLSIPYVNAVLDEVPVYRAEDKFLNQYGSSVGIYFRKSLYIGKDAFDPEGIDASISNLAILTHEAWHAYYDLLMPAEGRRQLERHWASYYGRQPGVNREDALCIGDETAGVYLQTLTNAYSMAWRAFARKREISPSAQKFYREAWDGKYAFGYCGNELNSAIAISSVERDMIRAASGSAFPPPELLTDRIKARHDAAKR